MHDRTLEFLSALQTVCIVVLAATSILMARSHANGWQEICIMTLIITGVDGPAPGGLNWKFALFANCFFR